MTVVVNGKYKYHSAIYFLSQALLENAESLTGHFGATSLQKSNSLSILNR